MRHLYQSNRLETLLALFLQLSRVPLSDPLVPECVIVQSKGVGRWLTVELARRLGIAANLDIRTPVSFIWKLTQAVYDTKSTRSVFSPEVLVWRILVWLDTAGAQNEPRLSIYLKQSAAKQRYALARRIADTFDHYLVYRTDWLASWEKGKILHLGPDEHWQSTLWRNLIGHPSFGGASEANSCAIQCGKPVGVQALLQHPRLAAYLPERITLFGIADLPPNYLAFFEHLSCHTDVCFFAMNPCQQYWGDLYEEQVSRGQLLLSRMGRQAQFFLNHLCGEGESHDLFVANEDTYSDPRDRYSLLHRLQDSVLRLSSVSEAIKADDDSLIFAVCHSPQRELEALHDQLLHWFSEDPSLNPSDILVLCTHIDTFEPYIEAVFSSRAGHPFIPWSLAGHRTMDSLITAVLDLFTLPQSRFGVSEVLGWLEIPSVHRRFDIKETDLPQLDRWVRTAGIRWGRDGAHRVRLGLPADSAHTWRFGLDRLLLSTVLSATPPHMWEGVAPISNLDWHDYPLLERFCHFVETLEWAADYLVEPTCGKEWQKRLLEIFDRLFEPDDIEFESSLQLRDALADFVECVNISAPTLLVTREWVQAELTLRLNTRQVMKGLFSGRVTFCDMTLMRGVPFRRIAILGLNDGIFPRNQPKIGFDLMVQHPRSGDFIQQSDDRYAFLEALLSARERLYLSYVGRHVRDHSPLPPSVLISDLLDMIAREMIVSEASPCSKQEALALLKWKEAERDRLLKRITYFHRPQAFHTDYFRESDLPRSYSRTWLARDIDDIQNAVGQALFIPLGVQDADKVSALTGRDHMETPENRHDPEEKKEVTLETLVNCFCNTSRFYLRERFNICLPWLDEIREDEEPFLIEASASHSLSRLIGQSIATPQEALSFAQASGWLPHGVFGELAALASITEGQKLADQLAKIPPAKKSFSHPWILNLPQGQISGTWSYLTEIGLIIPLTEIELRPAIRLAIWLQHLSLCAVSPVGVITQTWIATPEQLHCLSPISDAIERLTVYWEAWKILHNMPLPFFPKTSQAYVSARDRKSGLSAAKQEWNPGTSKHEAWQKGEAEDPWHALLWRGTSPLDPPWRAQFIDWAYRLWPSEAQWDKQ